MSAGNFLDRNKFNWWESYRIASHRIASSLSRLRRLLLLYFCAKYIYTYFVVDAISLESIFYGIKYIYDCEHVYFGKYPFLSILHRLFYSYIIFILGRHSGFESAFFCASPASRKNPTWNSFQLTGDGIGDTRVGPAMQRKKEKWTEHVWLWRLMTLLIGGSALTMCSINMEMCEWDCRIARNGEMPYTCHTWVSFILNTACRLLFFFFRSLFVVVQYRTDFFVLFSLWTARTNLSPHRAIQWENNHNY